MKFIVILSFLFSLSLFAEELVPPTDELVKTAEELNSSKEQAVSDVENFSPMPQAGLVQSNEEGIAIDGFDSVAYFKQSEAIRGVAQYNCEYQNKTWYFSSAENRDAFLSNPDKFAPQYGGFCAHSITSNKLVESNPESFVVRDDKLYLYVNDKTARKDVKKKDNIFAKSEKKRKKNWLNYERKF